MAAAPPDAGDGHRLLAAVVVNWHQERATISCVRRLAAWRRLVAAVTVVDNDSGDHSVAMLREALPDTTILACPRNIGFGAAVNRAAEATAAEYLLLLNNDAELTEEAAVDLLEALRDHPDAGIVGPVIEAAEPPHPVIAAGGRDLARHGRTHATGAEKATEIEAGRPYETRYVPGTAALLRRSCFDAVGGFEEEYFFSGEMADLCARARRAGHRCLIAPRARARHDLGVAGDLRPTLYAYYSLRNRFLFVRRHRPRQPWLLAVWAARGLLSAALAGRLDRARARALAVADGVRGRFGPADERVPR